MTRQAITTDDGQPIAVRILDRQAPDAAADDQTPDARASDLVAVLLHATLSTSEQLLPLARRLTTVRQGSASFSDVLDVRAGLRALRATTGQADPGDGSHAGCKHAGGASISCSHGSSS